ncbi:MAG: hypothetical protein JXJ04_10840 [Spirochaetales bacterium]|nr:hypothetical protein [Spirochaetales bacterium]
MENDSLSEKEVTSLLNSIIEKVGEENLDFSENNSTSNDSIGSLESENLKQLMQQLLQTTQQMFQKDTIYPIQFTFISSDTLPFNLVKLTLPKPINLILLETKHNRCGFHCDLDQIKKFAINQRKKWDDRELKKFIQFSYQWLLKPLFHYFCINIERVKIISEQDTCNMYSDNCKLLIITFDSLLAGNTNRWSLFIPQSLINPHHHPG